VRNDIRLVVGVVNLFEEQVLLNAQRVDKDLVSILSFRGYWKKTDLKYSIQRQELFTRTR
jgi:hypothetical protein